MAKIYHVTVGYPRTELTDALVTTARFEGFISAVLPEQWPNARITRIDKFHLLRAFVVANGLRDHDVVLFTDAFDVMIVKPAHEILRRFLATGAGLVFNAEINLFPADGRDHVRQAFDDRFAGDFRYLNSGCFVGYVWAIRAMLDWCLSQVISNRPGDHALDQELAQRYWLAQSGEVPAPVALDTQCEIFATLMGTADRFALSHGRVVGPGARDTCVLHANGNKHNLAILYALFQLFYLDGKTKTFTDLRLLSADGLACDYWPEQRRIIVGSQPGDFSVFLLGLGAFRSIALTARTGALSFCPGGGVTFGAAVMGEWEILNGLQDPLASQGAGLTDRVGAELRGDPVNLADLRWSWVKDLIGHVQTIGHSLGCSLA